MKGIRLSFYMYENQKHHAILMYEWLLEFGKKQKIPGGSAHRGMAGYGRLGTMHEEHFFELGSSVPVEVTFILAEEDANRFVEILEKEKIDLFYTKSAVEYNRIHSDNYMRM